MTLNEFLEKWTKLPGVATFGIGTESYNDLKILLAAERERYAKIGERLNKLERPPTHTPEEWEHAAMQVAARYGRDGGQRASAAGVNPGCAPNMWAQFMKDLWVEYVTALDEREAIVKWLRDGDRSCDCCGLTREVNPIEGSPIDFDQLCPECHFTKRHIAKSIEDGDHL